MAKFRRKCPKCGSRMWRKNSGRDHPANELRCPDCKHEMKSKMLDRWERCGGGAIRR